MSDLGPEVKLRRDFYLYLYLNAVYQHTRRRERKFGKGYLVCVKGG